MANKSKKPVVSFGKVMPKIYSAAGDAINNTVSFGIGTLDKIIASTDTSVGLIAFGYNDELKTGAIAVGGQLVSSKILDISTNATPEQPEPSEITVKYLEGSEIKEFKFSSINAETIEALDTSIRDLYQEIINNENVLVHYISYADISINKNAADISALLNSTTTADSSISNIESNYVKSVTAIDSSAIVVNDITPTGTTGKQYEIGLNVDDETVKIVNGELTALGNSYTLEALDSPSPNMLKTYQLYQTDAAGNKTAVQNSLIDIPKDFLINDVHLCKAEVVLDDDTSTLIYEEVVKQGDPDFDDYDGDIYLHFIWVTKDDDTSILSETYIKVTDMAPVYIGDADVDDPSIDDDTDNKYINVTSDHIITLDSSKLYDNLIEPLDTSIKDLYTQIENDELVIVQYLSYADASINKNAFDISTLKESSLDTKDNILDLSNNIDIIKENYVQNVEGEVTKEDIVVRNSYEPDVEDASLVEEEVVTDSSVTYTITKTVDGVSSVVTTITTVDTKVIDKIAELLAEDAKNIAELQNTTKWITL